MKDLTDSTGAPAPASGWPRWAVSGLGLVLVLACFTGGSVVLQHLRFATGTLDLGIYAEVSYNASHHGSLYSSAHGQASMGDHFSPILVPLGVLFWLWPNAAVLLLWQNLCIWTAVVMAFLLARQVLASERAAGLLAVFFASGLYLHRVNWVSFHPECLAIPVLLGYWLLWEGPDTRANRWRLVILTLVLLSIKEDMALIVGCFGLWLAVFRPARRRQGCLLAAVGFVALGVIMKVLLPAFSGGQLAHLYRYEALGRTPLEILATAVGHPGRVLHQLVTPPGKLRALGGILLSFGLLPLASPGYLLAAVPALGEHLLSGVKLQYMLWFHYSAAALPFLYRSTLQGYSNLLAARPPGSEGRRRASLRRAGRLLLAAAAVVLLVRRAGPYAAEYRLFDPAPYREFTRQVRPALPANCVVGTSNALHPHLIDHHCRLVELSATDVTWHEPVDYVLLSLQALQWQAAPSAEALARLRQRADVVVETPHFLLVKPRPGR